MLQEHTTMQVAVAQLRQHIQEAQILIERSRKHYNSKHPHSALGYRPRAPETIVQMDHSPVMYQQSTWTAQVGLISTLQSMNNFGIAIISKASRKTCCDCQFCDRWKWIGAQLITGILCRYCF